MSEIYTNKEGLKLRRLMELKPTMAKEYQDAMLNRVDYFSERFSKDSIFNNFTENVIVKGLSTILDVKVKIDEMLGDNKGKVQDFIEKILLFGL